MYNNQPFAAGGQPANVHYVSLDHLKWLNTAPGAPSNLSGHAGPGRQYYCFDTDEIYWGRRDGSIRDVFGRAPIFPLTKPFVASFIFGHPQYLDPESMDWEAHGGPLIWTGVSGSKVGQNSIFTLRETADGLQVEKAANSWAYHLRARKTAFEFGTGKTIEFIYRTTGNTYAMLGVGDAKKEISAFTSWTGFEGGQYHYSYAIRDWRHGTGSAVQDVPDLSVPANQSVKSVFPEGGSAGLTNHNSLVSASGPDLFAASEETGSPLDYVCLDAGKAQLICFHVEPVYTGVGRHLVLQAVKVA